MASIDPWSGDLKGNRKRTTAMLSRPGLFYSLLRTVGSLWYAAVVLILLLVAMACATVYESTHGTERALGEFYYSWWFKTLLALLALNVLAAVIVRYPFTRRQIGFVITHVSILVTLGGALVTDYFGVNNGQVGLAEGESATHFTTPVDNLTVKNRITGAEATVDLTSRDFGKFTPVDHPRAPVLTLGDLQLEIARYLPDSELSEEVLNDNPRVRHAVEVSLSGSGQDTTAWIFANRPGRLGMRDILFRVIEDDEEFARLMSKGRIDETASDGTVTIGLGDSTVKLSLRECLEKPVAVGDTGYTVHVLRYMPHANVGPDNKLRNMSDEPVNPAIECELTGPKGDKETRFAFSRFPEFGSMHGEKQPNPLKLSFAAPGGHAATKAIELLGRPDGELHVRFTPRPDRVLTRGLTLGTPVESPWPLERFNVLRRFDHARINSSVVPLEPRTNVRVPAVILRLSTTEHTSDMAIQKFRSQPVTVGGVAYDVKYGNKVTPLGFTVQLNQFHVGYYPGGSRPRSFESHVTFMNPVSGGEHSRVISMNNPAQYGGYTLFQSRYRMDGRQKISFLSVARDPGQPIVFTGYIGMMAGMGIVLVTRIRDRRRTRPVANREVKTGRGLPAASLNIDSQDRSDAGRNTERAKCQEDVPAHARSAKS